MLKSLNITASIYSLNIRMISEALANVKNCPKYSQLSISQRYTKMMRKVTEVNIEKILFEECESLEIAFHG